jgi:hypothetical protein
VNQVMRRLKKSLRRLELKPIPLTPEPEPMDHAWRDMLARLDRGIESDRRMAEAEKALNRLR